MKSWHDANNKEKIWCMRKRDKPHLTSTKKILYSNEFYAIPRLTQDEIQFLICYFQYKYPKDVLMFLIKTLNGYQKIFQYSDSILEDKDKILTSECSDSEAVKKALDSFTEIEHFLNVQKCNGVEDLYSTMETELSQQIGKLQNMDNSFFYCPIWDDSHSWNSKSSFLYNVSTQYFRTRRMRKWLCQSIDEKTITPIAKILGLNPSNISSEHMSQMILMSFQLALSDYLYNNDAHMTILTINEKQSSEISFITCDQPVINLFADYKGNGEAKALVLYYPLSPKVAIMVNDRQDKNIIQITDDNVIDQLNHKMKNASSDILVGNSCDVLERYKD